MIKKLSIFDKLKWQLVQWKGFKLPKGERIDCWKDRRRIDGLLLRSDKPIFWATNSQIGRSSDPGKIGSDGVGHGTPMQLGRDETRIVTWGSGYGRYNQWKARVPLPLLGNRYWITGYPHHSYDRRCIIMDPQEVVHELIQFDQDLEILPAGLPQQALNRGSWKNGVLIDGKATTAAELPSHGYIWGIGSLESPHVQAMTIQDYLSGDGTDEFKALAASYNDLPVCGDWYYLPPESLSYKEMISKGGQCAARAQAMAEFGVRLIDRGGTTSFTTQAGSWADKTNLREFQININHLRRVEY
jgi:hypothetical protein